MRRSGDLNLVFTAETRRRGVMPSGIQTGDVENGTAQRQKRTKTLAQRVSVGKEGKTIRTAKGAALCLWQTLRATLREIFDETAYDRFLARAGAPRSIGTYREFLREREEAMVRKPRCC
jgi:hypothetical protein